MLNNRGLRRLTEPFFFGVMTGLLNFFVEVVYVDLSIMYLSLLIHISLFWSDFQK